MPDIIDQIEDDKNKVATRLVEASVRSTYRRRGSDLVFAATEDNRVQMTRVNHRFKKETSYVVDVAFIEQNREVLKAALDAGGYKLAERVDLSQSPPKTI